VGVHSVGQMGMGVVEEQDDSLNEFGWMIVREIDSSSVKCVTLRICVDCVLT
jgi:hypothetical protein